MFVTHGTGHRTRDGQGQLQLGDLVVRTLEQREQVASGFARL